MSKSFSEQLGSTLAHIQDLFDTVFQGLLKSGGGKKKNKVISNISKKNKCKYKVIYSVSGESFLSKKNDTTLMIQKIIKKVTKEKAILSTTGGTSDARFIRKISPCLEFGLVGKTMHKIDEAVSLKDLRNLTKIYNQILKEFFLIK